MTEKKQKMSKKFTVKMQKKLLFCFLAVVVFFIALSVVLIRINLSKGKSYSKAVYDNFNYDSRVIPARRGDITDRNGTVLAYSTKTYNLILDAKVLLSDKEYREPTVTALLKYFDLNEQELNDYIDENVCKKENGQNAGSYKRLLTSLSEDEIAGFLEESQASKSKIKGVWFEEEYTRVYPYNSLAADLIGFASEANGGELGIESTYESWLAGIDGREYGYIDNSAYSTTVIDQINGDKVVSTIDIFVQNVIEEEIRKFNEAYGSESSSVMVMDPNTGEILGMCDYPTFDLNNPRDLSAIYSEEELEEMTDEEKVEAMFGVWSNFCVSSIYEPGSVFKTFTVAAALEENIANSESTYICDGEGIYNQSKILCHGGEGHGELSLGETLAWSCNDALMQIGMEEGITLFSKYIRAFKFGEKTEIDLISEGAGLLRNPDDMMDVDLVTNAFGQNLNVTMVQTAAAFASVINGGSYYKPHVVKEIQNSAGEAVKKFEPVLVGRTISEENSKIMRSYLRSVVDYGTGYLLYREGYSIGGKTGTAEKQPRDKENYVVSFLAFAPAEKPEIMVYVVIDSPNIAEYDSSTAAQIVAASIMDRLMPYYGIGQDYADYEVPLVHVNTSEDKKNGELVVSSDGIIVVTGERFMPTRDEIKDEEGDEPKEEGEDTPEESQGEDGQKDDSPDDSPDAEPEEGESGEE
ncbi:MAG: peptidoglycan D,D-transpeptidase FtsI family protein [Butyrivibrio sp.]